MSNLEVKQFAVKYNPPTLVIQYRNNSNGKTFLKNIRLMGTLITDAEKLTDKIIQENSDLLGPKSVPRTQVLDLMKLIVSNQGQKPASVSLQVPVQQSVRQTGQQSTCKEYGDLNKASDVAIEKAKSEMNVDFEANRIQPDDKNFVWDKKVDFAPPVGTSDWDDDE